MAARGIRLHYVDCAGPLLLNAKGDINPSLMNDAFHPSLAGYDKLFTKCYDAHIHALLGAAH